MSKAAARPIKDNSHQENLFDFSEIILNDHGAHNKWQDQVDATIECVEGTGGSGTSEITANLFKAMQDGGAPQLKTSLSGQGLLMIDQSITDPNQNQKTIEDRNSIASSSRLSYQFLPSNQQVSFANTNSGSKDMLRERTTTEMS